MLAQSESTLVGKGSITMERKRSRRYESTRRGHSNAQWCPARIRNSPILVYYIRERSRRNDAALHG